MVQGYKAMMISADKSGFTDLEEEKTEEKSIDAENAVSEETVPETESTAPETADSAEDNVPEPESNDTQEENAEAETKEKGKKSIDICMIQV